MSSVPGAEPVEDEELIYRRISLAFHDPSISKNPHIRAFQPRKEDVGGLSVSREKYCESPEEVARQGFATAYYVAVFRVIDLRKSGIDVIPDPLEGDPGHALIPALNYEKPLSDRALELSALMAEKLHLRIEGPFVREE